MPTTTTAPFSAAAFNAAVTPAIEGVLGDSAWSASSRPTRRWNLLFCLRPLPLIGDWLIDQEHQFMQYFIDQAEKFSGPTIPDKPASEWLQEWWAQTFEGVLVLLADPVTNGDD